MKKRVAVAFTGVSGSGKTTAVSKVAKMLIDSYKMRVAIIKSDPKDKAVFDTVGKDSYIFSQTGAQVVVASPKKTTLLKPEYTELDEIVRLFGEFDVLIVEGLKSQPLPRICIARDKLYSQYIDLADALAVDDSVVVDRAIHKLQILDLNSTKEMVEWILANGKEI